MKFSELNLHPTLLAAVEKLGFESPTPIQETVIPHILAGKDVAGLAQTGTGKTAAFVLPLIDRIFRSQQAVEGLAAEELEIRNSRAFTDWKKQNFILVMVPTRELCEQVCQEVVKLRGTSSIQAVAIYGGTGYDKQIEALKQGAEFVVGTPGRLIDLYKGHNLDLQQVRAVVFDEADRMFDMGFKDDMKFLLRRIPKERQYLVFSATLNFDVLNTAYMFGSEPVEFNLSRDQAKAENVKDEILHVGSDEKPAFLLSLLKKVNPKQTIVFSNFKHNVHRIAAFLNANGYPAVAISSLLTQAQRTRVMEQFKAENDKNILVATDVAARGLDIKGVDLVINFELSDDCETYVHRIGRTGRAGAEGIAYSLVSDRDVEALQRIEDYVKHKLNVCWLDENEIVKDCKPFPRDVEPGEEDRPRREGGRRPERSGGGRRDGRRDDRERRDTRDSRGPRDSRDQRGRRDNRDQRDQRDQREQREPRDLREPREPREPREHRDRKMGRHGQRDNREAREGAPAGRDGRPQDKHPRRDRRPHGDRSGQRRPHTPRAPVAAKPKSIGEKVSSFFKRIFGG